MFRKPSESCPVPPKNQGCHGLPCMTTKAPKAAPAWKIVFHALAADLPALYSNISSFSFGSLIAKLLTMGYMQVVTPFFVIKNTIPLATDIQKSVTLGLSLNSGPA